MFAMTSNMLNQRNSKMFDCNCANSRLRDNISGLMKNISDLG